MQHEQGWKTVLAVVYAVICLVDFIVVPAWYGAVRVSLGLSVESLLAISDFPPEVIISIINAITEQHSPYTLQGGGLFHLAYGALLTGSAISKS